MKKLGLLLWIICIIGCGKKGTVTVIDSKTAKEMMKTEVTIIDVRTKTEYEDEHIPNAINIPLDSIQLGNTKLPKKDATILVYCKSGTRSKEAASKLSEMGFLNIYDFGGMDEWPYETESENLIKKTEKKSWEASVYQIIESLKMDYIFSMEHSKTYTFPTDELTFTGIAPIGGSITVEDGKVYGAIYNEDWCAKKEKESETILFTNYVEGACK